LSSPQKRGAKKWGIAFSDSPSERHIKGPGRSREETDTNLNGFNVSRVLEAERNG
jgi:hypothetical protein